MVDESTLKAWTEALKSLQQNVRDLDKRVDDDVLPAIHGQKGALLEAIKEHEDACPLRQGMNRRIENETARMKTKDSRPPAPRSSFHIPKHIWIGIGIAVASALGAWFGRPVVDSPSPVRVERPDKPEQDTDQRVVRKR